MIMMVHGSSALCPVNDISRDIWPPRSPDLNPPEFFLWEAMKASVYIENYHIFHHLKEDINHFIRNILHPALVRVFANKMKSLDACLQARCAHFQHL
jgi:hypothetical protein